MSEMSDAGVDAALQSLPDASGDVSDGGDAGDAGTDSSTPDAAM
jgi:hypothetical protein